jgi:hypothetical protein
MAATGKWKHVIDRAKIIIKINLALAFKQAMYWRPKPQIPNFYERRPHDREKKPE